MSWKAAVHANRSHKYCNDSVWTVLPLIMIQSVTCSALTHLCTLDLRSFSLWGADQIPSNDTRIREEPTDVDKAIRTANEKIVKNSQNSNNKNRKRLVGFRYCDAKGDQSDNVNPVITLESDSYIIIQSYMDVAEIE